MLLYATLRYSTLLYATLRYSTLLYATLRYATQKLPTSKQIKNNNMILHLHLFCQTNTKMNNKLYNLDFYSVGCSTRSLRSNHVPHRRCGRLYMIQLVIIVPNLYLSLQGKNQQDYKRQ
jgi:hypothetical protein